MKKDYCNICNKNIELLSLKSFKEHHYCIKCYKKELDKLIEENRNLPNII